MKDNFLKVCIINGLLEVVVGVTIKAMVVPLCLAVLVWALQERVIISVLINTLY